MIFNDITIKIIIITQHVMLLHDSGPRAIGSLAVQLVTTARIPPRWAVYHGHVYVLIMRVYSIGSTYRRT